MVSGLTQNLCHCERSEAIQTCPHGKEWIATPPAEARNDDMPKSLDTIMKVSGYDKIIVFKIQTVCVYHG